MHPDDEAVAASAREAPILQRFRDLVEAVGDGIDVDEARQLPLPVGRALAERWIPRELLEALSQISAALPSTQPPEVTATVQWARDAGVLRLAKGRLYPTKRGRAIDDDPVTAFRYSAAAIVPLAPYVASRASEVDWRAYLDDGVQNLIILILERGSVEMLELEELAAVEVEARFPEPDPEVDRLDDVGEHVRNLVERLALAGVVRIDELDANDLVELTPAGLDFASRRAGALAELMAVRIGMLSASELLAEAVDIDDDEFEFELAAWIARRDQRDAAQELLDAMRATNAFDEQMIGMLALARIGDAAVPIVGDAVDDPRIGVLARFWLVEHGHAPSDSLDDGAMLEVLAEVLAMELRTDGPRAVVHEVERFGDAERQRELLDLLRLHGGEATVAVLDAIGRHHPDKTVAKAARKAALRLRSAQRAAAAAPSVRHEREGRFRPRS